MTQMFFNHVDFVVCLSCLTDESGRAQKLLLDGGFLISTHLHTGCCMLEVRALSNKTFGLVRCLQKWSMDDQSLMLWFKEKVYFLVQQISVDDKWSNWLSYTQMKEIWYSETSIGNGEIYKILAKWIMKQKYEQLLTEWKPWWELVTLCQSKRKKHCIQAHENMQWKCLCDTLQYRFKNKHGYTSLIFQET